MSREGISDSPQCRGSTFFEGLVMQPFGRRHEAAEQIALTLSPPTIDDAERDPGADPGHEVADVGPLALPVEEIIRLPRHATTVTRLTVVEQTKVPGGPVAPTAGHRR